MGSIAWDGYPSGIWPRILKAKTEKAFRKQVGQFLKSRDDATYPYDGWPWPWENSQTTDYAYAFDAGKVWACSFGCGWFNPLGEEPEYEYDEPKTVEFPDMAAVRKVNYGKRSGLVIVGRKPDGSTGMINDK